MTSSDREFDERVAPYRAELQAHCYRMLGSMHDAEDALQDTLIGAWRGLDGFEGRSSLRSWLYRISTNSCLRLLEDRPKRLLSADFGPPRGPDDDLGEPVDAAWLEPCPDEFLALGPPESSYELRESVELAFVAALQHLPANQRAVLIMREVLGFSATEVAESLDTSVASVTSALQRARKTVADRVPARSQQATLTALGSEGERELVQKLVTAWENANIDEILRMLTEDVRFTMPPLAAWFDGIDDVGAFIGRHVFATPWRLTPTRANGQVAFVCRQGTPDGAHFAVGAVNVLTFEGNKIKAIQAFLDPAVLARFTS